MTGSDPERDGSGSEELSTGSPLRRRTRIVIAISLLVVGTLLGLIATTRGNAPIERVSVPTDPAVSRVVVSPTSPILQPRVDSPIAAVRAASVLLCRHVPRCVVSSGDEVTRRRALRALGPDVTVEARTVGPGIGRVVAAATAGGAQLLAIVTPGQAAAPDTSALGIAPPLGVQTQANGKDRLTVIVSGNVNAIAVLSRASVQQWLARLHVT